MQDLADGIFPFFQEAVVLIKGKYDLKRSIETLEDYMLTMEIVSDHTVEGSGPLLYHTARNGKILVRVHKDDAGAVVCRVRAG